MKVEGHTLKVTAEESLSEVTEVYVSLTDLLESFLPDESLVYSIPANVLCMSEIQVYDLTHKIVLVHNTRCGYNLLLAPCQPASTLSSINVIG
jgi:hypothetical protein